MRLRFARFGTATTLLFGLLLGSALAWCDADESDPLEGFNRGVYQFNDVLDRNLLKPAAKGYQAVTPQFVDTGVSNVFTNLGKVPALVNHVLQWRLAEAGSDGRRFFVNSTLGLFGLFDVASKLGIAQYDTDLGVTLGRWGVGSGPYIMLPFFGPSTVRDGFGRGGDLFLHPLYHVDDETTKWSLRALEVVDLRADLLSVEELITGDRYVFLRNLYLQRRQFQITGELPEDDFGDEDF